MKKIKKFEGIMQFFSILLIFILFNSTFAFAQTAAENNAETGNTGTQDTIGSLADATGTETGDTETGQDATGNLADTTDTGDGGTTGNPDDTTNGAGTQPANATEPNPPEVKDTVKTAEFQCKNPSTNPQETMLLPAEVQKLMQGIQNLGKPLGKPFTGQQIESPNADKDKNKLSNRDKLENSQVVIPTGAGKDALLDEMPAAKFDIGEAPFANNQTGYGPFAIGISLDDSLRVGRCADIQTQIDQNSCPMTDRRLEFRNSGEGIKQDFKSVWTDLKDWVGIGPDMQEQYTDEETEKIKTALAAESDPEKTQYKGAYRIPGNPIPNSILTQTFTAEIGSTCTTAECVISSYSAFDKYFNSWFSAGMVVTSFGPTFIGQAKRYLGWLGRRGWPWTMSENKFYDAFRKKFMSAGTLFGDARIANMKMRTDKFGFNDFRKAFWEGTGGWQEGYGAIKGGSTRKMLDDWLKAGGKLDTEITDPVRRGEFFKLVKEWRSLAQTNKAVLNEAFDKYQGTIAKYGMESAEGKAAIIEYGQIMSKGMRDIDTATNLDFPEYWMKENITGFQNAGVKDAATGKIVELTGDSHHITSIMQKFEQEGHWGNWQEFAAAGKGAGPERFYEATQEGFLVLYKPDPAGRFLESVTVSDLQKNFSRFTDRMAQLENGDLIKIDSTSISQIIGNGAPSGQVKIFEHSWKPTEFVTPEDFAKRLTRSRARNRLVRQFSLNTDRLYNTLIERGWAGMNRRYFSLLDKAAAQEEEIIKAYFSIKGGAKWTMLPYLYWGMKRGIGFEGLSAYQLPDSWRAAKTSIGETQLYDDAFIDFFANEGSDEGDLFAQMLNILPWKMVLNKVSEEFLPADAYSQATGLGPVEGYRTKPENLALFSQTGDSCKTCNWTYNIENLNMQTGKGAVGLQFRSREGTSNIMVEDVISDDAKEKGSTIVSFAHHTDIDWTGKEAADSQDTKLDLVQAQKDKETCKDALLKAPIVGWFGRFDSFKNKPERAAAAMVFGESMLYFVFGWSGIIGSVIQQTMIAPEFQDCVDDLEGYYIHLFAPAKEKTAAKENPNISASEKGSEIFKTFTDVTLGQKQADDKSKTFLDAVKDKVREESEKLTAKAESKSITQAMVETQNLTTGKIGGKQLFFFWYKGEQNMSKYDKTRKAVIKDPESDIDVLVDNEAGKIKINGEDVITNPDLVRMAAPNGNIPAYEIPQRITKIVLPTDSRAKEELFIMGINSEMFINTKGSALAQQVFGCIKKALEEQTGLPLNSDNLSEAFGKVKAIVSDTHPSITADELAKTITAEGTPREIVYGDSSQATIKANMEVELIGEKGRAKVGRMDSIQFENGVIIFKPETNELLIWLKHHDKAILNQNDVEGIIAKPTTVQTEGMDCPAPAIDLEAIPKAGSDLIAKKVDNFNTSMDTMGPFTVFDTDNYRFIFYGKRVNGICKNFFKTIDKKTGEVYEQEITGPLEKTPTGIKFTTADGKEHTLDFSTENGVPMVSYDKQPAETLRTATGPNGSFWYDPTTGNWYPENAQLIPLDEAFRQKGFSTSVGPDGKVSQTPGGNPLTVNVGTGGTGTPFNLPSLPENALQMLLFFSLLLGVIIIFRIKIEKENSK